LISWRKFIRQGLFYFEVILLQEKVKMWKYKKWDICTALIYKYLLKTPTAVTSKLEKEESPFFLQLVY
jgi:hypothetical protein